MFKHHHAVLLFLTNKREENIFIKYVKLLTSAKTYIGLRRQVHSDILGVLWKGHRETELPLTSWHAHPKEDSQTELSSLNTYIGQKMIEASIKEVLWYNIEVPEFSKPIQTMCGGRAGARR